MDARVAFTSAGVNRAAGALDWDLGRGDHGAADDDDQHQRLMAYGSASAVCLFDPEVSPARDGDVAQRWRYTPSTSPTRLVGVARTRERDASVLLLD